MQKLKQIKLKPGLEAFYATQETRLVIFYREIIFDNLLCSINLNLHLDGKISEYPSVS